MEESGITRNHFVAAAGKGRATGDRRASVPCKA